MGNNGEFDIKSLFTVDNANEGVWMDIHTPNGDVTGLRFKVLGTDSKVYKKGVNTKLAKERALRTGAKLSPAEDQELTMATFSNCVVDWEGVGSYEEVKKFNEDGSEKIEKVFKPLPCTPDNVKNIFLNSSIVYEQVVKFGVDNANFLAL